MAPLERLELSLPAPEADALSTELQGRMKKILPRLIYKNQISSFHLRMFNQDSQNIQNFLWASGCAFTRSELHNDFVFRSEFKFFNQRTQIIRFTAAFRVAEINSPSLYLSSAATPTRWRLPLK